MSALRLRRAHAKFLATLLGCLLPLIVPSLPNRRTSRRNRKTAHRVVFLGDSITYAGQYVEFVEAYLRPRDPATRAASSSISACPARPSRGSPSRATPGGSSPGPTCTSGSTACWRRPKPDLVVACYGMNDGIYLPFDEERFQKFQDGIVRLRERVGGGRSENHSCHAANF